MGDIINFNRQNKYDEIKPSNGGRQILYMVGSIAVAAGLVLGVGYYGNRLKHTEKERELAAKTAYTLADVDYSGSLDKEEFINMAKGMGVLEATIACAPETLNPKTIPSSDMAHVQRMVNMTNTKNFKRYIRKFNGIP